MYPILKQVKPKLIIAMKSIILIGLVLLSDKFLYRFLCNQRITVPFSFLHHLNQPYITVYHKITDGHLNQFRCLYEEVHTYDTESGIVGQ